MTGVFYVRSELRAPWALLMPHWEDTLWFHVVVAGRAVLDTGDGLLDLRPGDLLLAPHGRRHVMASEPGHDAVDVTALEHDYENDRCAVLLYGGEGRVRRSSAAPCGSAIRPPARSSTCCRP